MDETKIRLLYNKAAKELVMVISPVEEGSEAYNKMKELAKEMVEIELKKVISDEKIDLEKSVDITPSPETEVSKTAEVKSEAKSKPDETKPEKKTEPVNVKSEEESKSVEMKTAEVKSEAESKLTVTPTEEAKSEPVEANTKPVTPIAASTNKSTTPLNTTFVIKAGETQLSIKDFAEANGLFQPRFMSGNKFRVTEKEVEVYEKAGYSH